MAKLKSQKYLKELLAEKKRLNDCRSEDYPLTQQLIDQELRRLQNEGKKQIKDERKQVDVVHERPIRITVKVVVPVRDHPKFNFVGKLLGPKGNSLKRLQDETLTKMAILGKGSMRDKEKEEKLRETNDPRYSHLHDDLHVEITTFATPAEAYARIACALSEIRRFLVPDYNDDIRQEQMREMHLLSSSTGDLSEENAAHPDDTSCLPSITTVQASSGIDPPTGESQSLDTEAFSGLEQINNATQEASLLPGNHKLSVTDSLCLANSTVRSIPPAKRNILSVLNKTRRLIMNRDRPKDTVGTNLDATSYGLLDGFPLSQSLQGGPLIYLPSPSLASASLNIFGEPPGLVKSNGSLNGQRFLPYPRLIPKAGNP